MILRRESLEDILARLEELYDGGQLDKARKELRRARRDHPHDLTLLEWDATLASDEERYGEALELLDEVLAAEPDRPFARREKVAVLMGLGRFAEALRLLEEIGADHAGEAAYHFDRALCLDRSGRNDEADREFREAERLDSEEFRRPARLSHADFQKAAREAIDEIPEGLKKYLDNVIVEVLDYPVSPPVDEGFDPNLLGLYVGVGRTERTQESRDHLDRIFIFKRNLEIAFPARAELKEEIRKTVIHEIAHHFGLGEEDMGDYA
jgi:predicted Zn-dependent protease with MMP-like domain